MNKDGSPSCIVRSLRKLGTTQTFINRGVDTLQIHLSWVPQKAESESKVCSTTLLGSAVQGNEYRKGGVRQGKRVSE